MNDIYYQQAEELLNPPERWKPSRTELINLIATALWQQGKRIKILEDTLKLYANGLDDRGYQACIILDNK